MYAVMNEDEACLLSAIKAGAPLNSHIDLGIMVVFKQLCYMDYMDGPM